MNFLYYELKLKIKNKIWEVGVDGGRVARLSNFLKKESKSKIWGGGCVGGRRG